MLSENLIKQQEEIASLSSIYEDDWTAEGGSTYQILIKENGNEAALFVTMPPEYPGHAPPKFELSAPWMSRKDKAHLHQALNHVYLKHIGETVVYQWVEKVREILLTKPPVEKLKVKTPSRKILNTQVEVRCPEITHGAVIVDRKSCFQGHAAQVHSVEEVNAVLAKLKENKKILHAKHNMFAYRIELKTKRGTTIEQEADDDGEAHASGRMMKLLELLDQRNTLVVVTRWYGGIHLGPDRFRHINNASRQVIEQAGLLKAK